MAIILQYIHISNHHVAYLKLTQRYINYNSIKFVDKRKNPFLPLCSYKYSFFSLQNLKFYCSHSNIYSTWNWILCMLWGRNSLSFLFLMWITDYISTIACSSPKELQCPLCHKCFHLSLCVSGQSILFLWFILFLPLL